MVLLTNSEIAATVMVDFRFNMGIHYAKMSKSTFVREDFGEIVLLLTQKKLGQTRFSHQKCKATLTFPTVVS